MQLMPTTINELLPYLSDSHRAGVELRDALVGLVTSLPHPIILKGRGVIISQCTKGNEGGRTSLVTNTEMTLKGRPHTGHCCWLTL